MTPLTAARPDTDIASSGAAAVARSFPPAFAPSPPGGLGRRHHSRWISLSADRSVPARIAPDPNARAPMNPPGNGFARGVVTSAHVRKKWGGGALAGPPPRARRADTLVRYPTRSYLDSPGTQSLVRCPLISSTTWTKGDTHDYQARAI